MARNNTPQHRKFIALILSLSLAVTGFSAVPARADEDVAKVIAGLALLGIIGAAINDRRDDHRPAVTHNRPNHGHGGQGYGNRPLPSGVARYDVPAQCLRVFPRYSQSQKLLGQGCLRKNYRHANRLPHSCKVTFWNGRKHKTGYRPGCLRKNGYRLVVK